MNPQISLFINFFIKNGSHSTIHTFKNYFVTVFFNFQFSAVSKRTVNLYWLNYGRDKCPIMEEICKQCTEFAAVLGFQSITVKNKVSSLMKGSTLMGGKGSMQWKHSNTVYPLLMKILSEGEHPFAEFGHLLSWLTFVISWE